MLVIRKTKILPGRDKAIENFGRQLTLLSKAKNPVSLERSRSPGNLIFDPPSSSSSSVCPDQFFSGFAVVYQSICYRTIADQLYYDWIPEKIWTGAPGRRRCCKQEDIHLFILSYPSIHPSIHSFSDLSVSLSIHSPDSCFVSFLFAVPGTTITNLMVHIT